MRRTRQRVSVNAHFRLLDRKKRAECSAIYLKSLKFLEELEQIPEKTRQDNAV